jgi:hypothetical protein
MFKNSLILQPDLLNILIYIQPDLLNISIFIKKTINIIDLDNIIVLVLEIALLISFICYMFKEGAKKALGVIVKGGVALGGTAAAIDSITNVYDKIQKVIDKSNSSSESNSSNNNTNSSGNNSGDNSASNNNSGNSNSNSGNNGSSNNSGTNNNTK